MPIEAKLAFIDAALAAESINAAANVVNAAALSITYGVSAAIAIVNSGTFSASSKRFGVSNINTITSCCVELIICSIIACSAIKAYNIPIAVANDEANAAAKSVKPRASGVIVAASKAVGIISAVNIPSNGVSATATIGVAAAICKNSGVSLAIAPVNISDTAASVVNVVASIGNIAVNIVISGVIISVCAINNKNAAANAKAPGALIIKAGARSIIFATSTGISAVNDVAGASNAVNAIVRICVEAISNIICKAVTLKILCSPVKAANSITDEMATTENAADNGIIAATNIAAGIAIAVNICGNGNNAADNVKAIALIMSIDI